MKILIIVLIIALVALTGCSDYEMHEFVSIQEEAGVIDLGWNDTNESASEGITIKITTGDENNG